MKRLEKTQQLLINFALNNMDKKTLGAILLLTPLIIIISVLFITVVKEEGFIRAIVIFGITFLLIASLSIGTYLLDN